MTLEAHVAAKGGWNLHKHSDCSDPECPKTSQKNPESSRRRVGCGCYQ